MESAPANQAIDNVGAGTGGGCAAARAKLYKQRLCESHLLQRCRHREGCTFAHSDAAHSDAELSYWRSQARRPERPLSHETPHRFRRTSRDNSCDAQRCVV